MNNTLFYLLVFGQTWLDEEIDFSMIMSFLWFSKNFSLKCLLGTIGFSHPPAVTGKLIPNEQTRKPILNITQYVLRWKASDSAP